ncbi:MAG: pyrroline-5-carboxylate reductase, partial [Dehalococcoidia bacterium]|nr:pyrroline-5-carboxylate reductase [Dehalococcoidia bacterium]
NLEAAEQGDIIVLAVKPQAMPGVMAELKGKIPSNNPVISIVAGVNTAVLRTGLDHTLIVRAMPNTPAQIGAGMTVWTATHEVSAIQKGTAEAIFSSLGKELYVNDEKFLDMATAISGSGPAYIFLVIEALIDAAVHMGFTRDTATDMVSQTVLGSAMLMSKTGKHPAELRNMVTSPGGTTAEALLKLEAGGLRGLIMQAVVAAYDKSKKLGDVSHK